MHVSHVDNELAGSLLLLFVKKFTKRRCVTYLAVDRLGPSAHDHNSAIRQLLKKCDILADKNVAISANSADKSGSKYHGCGELGHCVKDCPKGYNKEWLATQKCFKCGQLGHFRRDCPFKVSKQKSNPPSTFNMKTTAKPNNKLWYNHSAALPKMIGMLDCFNLEKDDTYIPYNSDRKKTKQGSDQWFDVFKGKINGSKAPVALGWLGRPSREIYWDEVRQGGGNTSMETSKSQLAMKWGSMCKNNAMATYISKFLSKTYPNCKVYETQVHTVNNENGNQWLASSPDGLIEINDTFSKKRCGSCRNQVPIYGRQAISVQKGLHKPH